MKKCKSCKAEIPNDAKKCKHCGADQRNWFGRHKVLTGIIILIIIFIGLGSSSAGKSGTSVPAAPDNSTNSAASGNSSSPTKTPQTLLDISGSGSKSTQKFTAGSDWDLNWTYDCSNFGDQGNFQVFIYNGDGSMSVENAGVNQLGKKDSGTEHYHTGGTYYLQVNSECDWTMNVKG